MRFQLSPESRVTYSTHIDENGREYALQTYINVKRIPVSKDPEFFIPLAQISVPQMFFPPEKESLLNQHSMMMAMDPSEGEDSEDEDVNYYPPAPERSPFTTPRTSPRTFSERSISPRGSRTFSQRSTSPRSPRRSPRGSPFSSQRSPSQATARAVEDPVANPDPVFKFSMPSLFNDLLHDTE